MVILFGGADRNQQHFSDLWILKQKQHDDSKGDNNAEVVDDDDDSGELQWESIETTGDIPPARSGHAMCVFEHSGFALLFGGINYPEEVAFNDLYTLDLSR